MKTFNQVEMKGRLYSYSLEKSENAAGVAVIMGEVTLEVDADGTTSAFRYYSPEVYKSGKENKTYGILDGMIAGNYKTVVDDGDDASWLYLTGSIDSSYFLPKNSKPTDDLARAQKIRGSFINPNSKKEYHNRWKLDFIITKIEEIEADEERNLPRYARISGYYIDDYNERVVEVQFQARKDAAINYILSLSADEEAPYFVSTWGELSKVGRLVVRKNAFGEDETDEYTSIQWVITGMVENPYDFGDESVITFDQFKEFKVNLNTLKDEQRKKALESVEAKPELAF